MLKKNKTKEAYQLLNHNVAQGASHSDIFYLLGEVCRLQGSNIYLTIGFQEESEFYLLKALQFELHSPYTYLSLALISIAKKQPEKAIPLLKHFLQELVDS